MSPARSRPASAERIDPAIFLINAEPDPATYTVGIKRDPASRGGSRYVHDELRVG